MAGWASPTPSEEDALDAAVRVPDDVVPTLLSAKARATTVSQALRPSNFAQPDAARDDAVPDEIRRWMARNHLRVRDVFKSFDSNGNGLPPPGWLPW